MKCLQNVANKVCISFTAFISFLGYIFCFVFCTASFQNYTFTDQNTSIPPGKQFCFEPMIDKRYNRWKRRRRKKKEIDNHRSSHMAGSESSDDEEDANERYS